RDGRSKGLTIDYAYGQRRFPGRTPDDPSVSNWLNAIENEHELIAYLADATVTDWTRKAIRQADQVLIVISGAGAEPVNPVEAFAFATHPPARRRLPALNGPPSRSLDGPPRSPQGRRGAADPHLR